MAALKIKYKNPHQLKPRARNPRTHTAKQIKQIAVSIKNLDLSVRSSLMALTGLLRDMAGSRQQNSSA
jgi:hypothetical protein